MTHQDALNMAHDLQRPFCFVTRYPDGRVMEVVPYYIGREEAIQ